MNHFGPGQWKYYAVLTNRNRLYQSPQEIMQHHAKRGNSENFIREEKYGYDLKHFPCQKLAANHAYGLFALVEHARQLTMKIPKRFRREVLLIREWTRAATSQSALARGTTYRKSTPGKRK